MNICTLSDSNVCVVPLTLRLRDQAALVAICRRLKWEFRADQRTYRWFGRWCGSGAAPAGVGTCAHAIGIPGCLYEIGLQQGEGFFQPIWDDGIDGGLTASLGPGAEVLWRSYGIEKIRREARGRRHRVTTHTDNLNTLRVRVAAVSSQLTAHVRMSGDGTTTLWTFGPQSWQTFRYLADALGEVGAAVHVNGDRHDPPT